MRQVLLRLTEVILLQREAIMAQESVQVVRVQAEKLQLLEMLSLNRLMAATAVQVLEPPGEAVVMELKSQDPLRLKMHTEEAAAQVLVQAVKAPN